MRTRLVGTGIGRREFLGRLGLASLSGVLLASAFEPTRLAPLAWVAVVAAQISRRRRREGLVRDRSKRAHAMARRRLDELAAKGDEIEGGLFFAELQRTLLSFLEDRLESAVAGDTSAELSARLKARGFGGELAEATVAEMESCDFARFARSASASAERRAALERTRALVDKLAAVAVEPEGGRP